LVLCSIS